MRPEPPANPCADFEAVTNAVLDRHLPPTALDSPHLSECPSCRELAGSVQLLLSALASPPPVPPDGFAFRVVAAAVRDRKRQARIRWGARVGGLAVAAGLLLAVYLGNRSAAPTPVEIVENAKPQPIPSHPEVTPTPRPAKVADKLAEAGSAFASITQKTADQALLPTRNLFPMPEPVELPSVPAIVPPQTDSLAQLPSTAKVGLEPVATSAKRAWNLFVRDVSGKPSS